MMALDLTSLRYFVAVTEQGGFARASRMLNVAQPALSRQIRLLEEDLGAALLTRSHRGVVPTEAGTLLLRRAEFMLRLAQQLRNEVADHSAEPTGRLRLGFPPSMGNLFLGRVLAEYAGTYRRVHFQLREAFSREVQELLLTDTIDLGVLSLTAAPPDLRLLPLFDEEVWLISTPSLWRFTEKTLPAHALAGLPLIYASHFRPAVLATLGKDTENAEPLVQADALTAILRFALAGGGYLLGAPSSAIDELADGRLVGAPVAGMSLQRVLGWRRDRSSTRAMQALIERVQDGAAGVMAQHSYLHSPGTLREHGKCRARPRSS